VINWYVGNLLPMPGVFADCPAPCDPGGPPIAVTSVGKEVEWAPVEDAILQIHERLIVHRSSALSVSSFPANRPETDIF
jgi:hypothetical protein